MPRRLGASIPPRWMARLSPPIRLLATCFACPTSPIPSRSPNGSQTLTNSGGAPLSLVASFLRRNIVFGTIVRANRALVRIRRILYAIDHVRFECLALFNQLLHALGVHIFFAGKSLEIAGLPAGFITHPAPRRARQSAQPARP